MRVIAASGVTILLIDHDMGLVLSICDYLYAIDFGRLIARGTPKEIVRTPWSPVISAQLRRQIMTEPAILSIETMYVGYFGLDVVRRIDLQVRVW